MDIFIWITVSYSGAWDNVMLWQINVQEGIFYFAREVELLCTLHR